MSRQPLESRILEHRGASIALHEIGKGPPVLFAHCSGGSHKQWASLARALADRHRCCLPDLIGCGGTSGHLDDRGQPIECHDPDLIRAVIDEADEPVHLIAHSFGAAACLEAARRSGDGIASMLLIEPPSFHLLRKASGFESELAQIRRLARRVSCAHRAGHQRTAAWHYMSFWIGALRWALAPRAMKREVVQSMDKVAFDFALVEELGPSLEVLGELPMPVTLIVGGRSPRPASAVVELLANTLPNGRRIELPRAGHMSPFTHRAQIWEIINAHLAAVGFLPRQAGDRQLYDRSGVEFGQKETARRN